MSHDKIFFVHAGLMKFRIDGRQIEICLIHGKSFFVFLIKCSTILKKIPSDISPVHISLMMDSYLMNHI